MSASTLESEAPRLIGDSLPRTLRGWQKYGDVNEASMEVQGSPVECGIFIPPNTPVSSPVESVTICVGGVPRSRETRENMSLAPRFFGYVALGAALKNNSVGLTFNWPGVGQSPGNVMESSIESRRDNLLEITETAMAWFGVKKVYLVGSSMGSYVSTVASMEMPGAQLGGLGLLSLPAFPPESHGVSYADGFGNLCRKPWEDRYRDSPITPFLEKTDTPTLIAYAEHDTPPILEGIQKMIRGITEQRNSMQHLTIPGVHHDFRRALSNEGHEGDEVDEHAVRTFGNRVIDFFHA